VIKILVANFRYKISD